MCKIKGIRIHHEYEGGIEKSILSITVGITRLASLLQSVINKTCDHIILNALCYPLNNSDIIL